MPAAEPPTAVPRVERGEPLSRSADLVADNVAKLRALFPEVLTETADGPAVNVDVLKALVGDRTVTDADEKFGLNWHGKRAARRAALTPTGGTLRPKKADSVEWDTTGNVVIEGDNLEVLKLLQKSYAGGVKLIYIDPPYNTGKDFVYPDDYRDGVRHYQRLTGQVEGEGGGKLTTNTETGGRFHTRWLNMMLPRVKLARELLREDGVMFVSVDDNEVGNLRAMCDDIFGGENFFGQIPWQSRTSVQNDTDLSVQHEYIVGYARSRRVQNRRLKESNAAVWHQEKSFAAFPLPLNADRYSNPDDDPRGPWKADPFDAPNERPNLTYPIVNPNTGEERWPPKGRCWRTEQEKFECLLADNRLVFGKTGDAGPQLKVFHIDKRDYGEVPTSWFSGSEFGTATQGTQELQKLFDGSSPFDFPKPTRLLKALMRLASIDRDIILDFFAGSGTTGHAVMAQNTADGGKRRYILVQLPEPLDPDDKATKAAAAYCDKLGVPRTLAELTKERLRRAAAKVRADHPDAAFDGGFRVYSLDTSNVRPWDPDRDDLEKTLLDAVDHVRPDRSADDLLTEVLLKLGLDLCTPIETRTAAGKDTEPVEVHCVGDGALFACLAEELDQPAGHAVADLIADWFRELNPAAGSTALFRDAAFASDVVKVNADATLRQAGLSEVRSL